LPGDTACGTARVCGDAVTDYSVALEIADGKLCRNLKALDLNLP